MEGQLLFQRKRDIHVLGGVELADQQPRLGALQEPLAHYQYA